MKKHNDLIGAKVSSQPSTPEPMIRLRHGTTRQRALAILIGGPDVDFLEPGGIETAGGFSTTPELGPFLQGHCEQYAAGKAKLFPQEGGPAILEIEVPDSIFQRAMKPGGEIRFVPGFGLEELLEAWSWLPKKIAP